MNQDWTKFINASILKHFDDLKQSEILTVEGVKPTPNALTGRWAELRIDGPDYRQLLKEEYKVDLSIDIMCNAVVTSSDLYSIHKLVGIFQEACINIQVYNFDTDTLDPDDPFFCLRRLEGVSTRQWGIIKKDVDVYCTSVAASYQGEFIWP